MARGSSETLLAELERLRSVLGKLDAELGRVQSRLAIVERKLSERDQRSVAGARELSKRVH